MYCLSTIPIKFDVFHINSIQDKMKAWKKYFVHLCYPRYLQAIYSPVDYAENSLLK